MAATTTTNDQCLLLRIDNFWTSSATRCISSMGSIKRKLCSSNVRSAEYTLTSSGTTRFTGGKFKIALMPPYTFVRQLPRCCWGHRKHHDLKAKLVTFGCKLICVIDRNVRVCDTNFLGVDVKGRDNAQALWTQCLDRPCHLSCPCGQGIVVQQGAAQVPEANKAHIDISGQPKYLSQLIPQNFTS